MWAVAKQPMETAPDYAHKLALGLILQRRHEVCDTGPRKAGGFGACVGGIMGGWQTAVACGAHTGTHQTVQIHAWNYQHCEIVLLQVHGVVNAGA